MNSPVTAQRLRRQTAFGIALMMWLVLLLLCACSGMPKAGSAAWGELGDPADPVPFMENVRTGTLPSGLRYYILENSMPENRAYLTLAVKAGSVLEEEHERGLSHFIEHMAFNGTARFPEKELLDYLRSQGMRFGDEVNAYTSFDEVRYRIEIPVETDENGIRRIPDTALAVIDEWSRAISFDPATVQEERSVILDEHRRTLGAWNRIREKWLPVLFRDSPYAERLPIGLPEVIENAQASDLEAFYKKWYQADNMALIIVGDFDGAALEASLGDHFLIPKPETPTDLPRYDLPPPQKGNIETLILTDPELPGTNIQLYFKRGQEAKRGDLSFFRSEIIDILIGRMLSFRFQDETVKPETPYVSAWAGTSRYAASSRFYVMGAQAKTGNIEASLTELLKAKESMLRYGFTETELSIAANALISDCQKMVQEKDREESSRYINLLSGYYLEGGNLADVEWELNAVQQLLPHITKKDINAAVKDYFASDDLQVFISAPDAEQNTLPGDARVKQIVQESRKMKIARPSTFEVADGLLRNIPVPGSVVSESTDEETGALLWELSNGAKVILKSTKNKNNEIILRAMARGGTSSAAPEDDISVSLALNMAQVSGIGPWSLPELSRKLAGKQANFSPWSSYYTRGFNGYAASGDLRTLFEMVYLAFTETRIDPVAVEAMMDQLNTSLANRNDDPQNVYGDEIRRVIFGDNYLFKPLEPADLPKADINTALAFIRKGLNPADYTFVFTGNLKQEVMKEYVETYLASVPALESNWNTWTDSGFTRPGKVETAVRKGKEAKSSVYMAWFSPASFNEELVTASAVLTQYLDIILTEEIREKLGIYAIGAGSNLLAAPRYELALEIGFDCDPGRVQELSGAVIEQLRQIAATSGINRDTFAKAVEALKKGWESSMQDNGYIANQYLSATVLLDNLPLSRVNHYPERYSAVTPEDIQRLCARLLENGPAQVVLLPE